MRQPISFLVKLCVSGMLLAAAWPQTGGEWTIDTVAGGGTGDNGPATSAQLAGPYGAAVDGAGNLYIADTSNHRIRKVGRRYPKQPHTNSNPNANSTNSAASSPSGPQPPDGHGGFPLPDRPDLAGQQRQRQGLRFPGAAPERWPRELA